MEKGIRDISPGDSVSQVGTTSMTCSTTSTARARASAKKAALAAKAALLKEKQELELSELKLNQKKDELNLRTEIAMAAAEEEIYTKAETTLGVNFNEIDSQARAWNPSAGPTLADTTIVGHEVVPTCNPMSPLVDLGSELHVPPSVVTIIPTPMSDIPTTVEAGPMLPTFTAVEPGVVPLGPTPVEDKPLFSTLNSTEEPGSLFPTVDCRPMMPMFNTPMGPQYMFHVGENRPPMYHTRPYMGPRYVFPPATVDHGPILPEHHHAVGPESVSAVVDRSPLLPEHHPTMGPEYVSSVVDRSPLLSEHHTTGPESVFPVVDRCPMSPVYRPTAKLESVSHMGDHRPLRPEHDPRSHNGYAYPVREPRPSSPIVTVPASEYTRPTVIDFEPVTKMLLQGERQQRQLLEALHLPQAHLTPFDGNPLNYWTFIRGFENSIGQSSLSDSAKLTRLQQYCLGKAGNLIRCCSVMSTNEGYNEAMRLLRQRFGNSHTIAEAWVQKVTTGGVIAYSDSKGLQLFADELMGCKITLDSMGYTGELNNQRVMISIVEKLPNFLRSRWIREARGVRKRANRSATIVDLINFIVDAAEEANDPVYGQLTSHSKENQSRVNKVEGDKPRYRAKGSNSNAMAGESPPKLGCLKCNGNHGLFACDIFKGLTPELRIAFAREKKVCFNCLRTGHWAGKCGLNRVCSVQGCGRKHTKFLHQTYVDSRHRSNDQTFVTGNSVAGPAQNAFVVEGSGSFNVTGVGIARVALPIVPVWVSANGKNQRIQTYALLDTGSTSTFCSLELANSLGVRGRAQKLSLTTLEKKCSITDTTIVSLEVTGLNGQCTIDLHNAYTKPELPIREENIAQPEDLEKWPHLFDLDLPQIQTCKVGLLIGQDAPEALIPLEVRVGSKGEPYATRTSLGWTLAGPLGEASGYLATNHFVNSESKDDRLECQLSQFWRIDSSESLAGDTRQMSVNDKEVVAEWEDTVCKEDGHYQLSIPFKKRPTKLPNNKVMAETRLRSLKRRLDRDPRLLERYREEMSKVLSEGYAELVPEDELTGVEGAVWYLPHHPVFNPMKPEKMRIVYDCASKFHSVSLNDEVHQGPDLTNKLLGVLLRFRSGKIALMADIQSMFHQVRVTPNDRDALRFLWWQDGNMEHNPKTYRMKVHLFGGTWSPSCCSYALQRTADDNKEGYHQDTIATVKNNFYVDDCLKSVDDEDKAIQLYHELCGLLATGGFKLTKWVTNSLNVLNNIPDEARAKNVKGLDFNNEALPTERALGVYWEVEGDCFGYKVMPKDKPLTRRGLLSTICSIFDPLGFASPFIIRAKKVVQELCGLGLGWDEQLPEEQLTRWINWKSELPKLDQLKVSRCLKPFGCNMVKRYELHHFSDASEMAYGSVSYLRVVGVDGQIHCGIVLAKTHLAPLKQMTIPRLELSAATLSIKLDQFIRRETDISIGRSVFWTDSTIVLQYIRNRVKRFHTFVANRISVIHEGSNPDQWLHVPTKLNPADDASRGLTAVELFSNDRWVKGPKFIWAAEESWPEQPHLTHLESDPEMKVPKVEVKTFLTESKQCQGVMERLFQRRSNWYDMLKDVGWLLRYKRYLQNKVRKQPAMNVGQSLTVDEMKLAEKAIVKHIQMQVFGEYMGDKLCTTKASTLYKLDPVLGDSGVLQVGGRLNNSSMSNDARHPMILPGDHHVTRLIAKYFHEQSGHSGREHVLSLMQERFWVIGARHVIRKVLQQCFPCKRISAPRSTQKMADLPKDRVSPDNPPFSFVGVDYFGPFMVKRGRSEVKRYGCLFTCLAIRAIHIEVAHTLDTDSFINALQRFMSRRGKPIEIRSDNGTNFVGAERELRQTIESWNQVQINDFLRQKMIQWKFNPPSASHMGGVWERMIRSTRKVMHYIVREQVLDDEKLSTLMCLVEAIINGRPLTYVSSDVKDMEPLTPNHLLMLRSGTSFPANLFDKRDMYCKRRWRQVQYLADVFWRRWTKEYLPLLQQRHKWISSSRNITVGDIILIVDENLPRNKWVLGKVLETYPGADNLVRKVQVKTPHGILVRPIHKLCLLEAVERAESEPIKC